MRAMILAAGYGTRLWPLTADRAKPAIPFMNRPLVGYVAEYLSRFGCRDIMVNLHHQSKSVRHALGDGSRFDVRLSYIDEPIILGTSGALDNARDFFATDEPFVVINGKIATDIDLSAAFESHRRTQSLATLVLLPNAKRGRYSTVEIRDGMVQGFGKYPEKPSASDNAGGALRASLNRAGQSDREGQSESELSVSASPSGAAEDDPPLMFTGIQILEPRIFEYIPRGVFSHSTTDVYPQAIARGERIAAHVAEGMWHELSTIPRYLDTSIELMHGEGRDVELGADAHIENGAQVSDAVLWENAHVESGAQVRRAVLGAGVRLRHGEVIENAAVVRADLVAGGERPEKALAGERKGDNFVVPLPE
ncbi:hypothetical protein BH18ACI2_BH18ACI2_25810 [soil metagenome]